MSEKPDYEPYDLDQAEEAATEAMELYLLLYNYYTVEGADGTSLMDRADTDPWAAKVEEWIQGAMIELREMAGKEVDERPDIRDRARGYLDAFFARHAAEVAAFEATLAEGSPEAARR
jgi:hypothetical protein